VTETTPADPVAVYRDQVIAWLWRKERKWRETAVSAPGAAADAASYYAAAYHNAAEGVALGEPEKRAAMCAGEPDAR